MTRNHTEDKMTFSGDARCAMPADALTPPYHVLGQGLNRSQAIFEGGRGRVAFLGGSITTMKGWRDIISERLEARFPATDFDFIDAGIGGTNSTYGTFRLQRDAWCHGSVDLLFLEFSVNDSRREAKPGNELRCEAYEGIIRQAKQLNPEIDIIAQYLVDQSKVEAYRQGVEPGPISDHMEIVTHYNLPAINQAAAITAALDASEFAWKDFTYDSCHPCPFGHEQYVKQIEILLDEAWGDGNEAPPRETSLPKPLHPGHLGEATLIPATDARIIKGWEMVRGWEAEKVCNYSGPVDVLTATEPGAELEFTFTGTTLALSAIAGMDAGRLELSLDDGPYQVFDLFDEYCPKFHRPIFPVLTTGLPKGAHTLRIRIAEAASPESTGTAARILDFGVA
ncbi:MAG: GDSL-type esterase/lipase family protein [Planctomycetota bacterium]|jgi:sialidase-1